VALSVQRGQSLNRPATGAPTESEGRYGT
jgi:hypothetical protein